MLGLGEHAYRLFFAVLVGVAIGLVSDVYRTFVRAFRLRGLALHILDGALMLGMALAVVLALQAGTKLSLRFYVALAVTGGLGLYFSLGSPLLMPLFGGFFMGIRQALLAVLDGLLWPFRLVWSLLRKIGNLRPPAGNGA